MIHLCVVPIPIILPTLSFCSRTELVFTFLGVSD